MLNPYQAPAAVESSGEIALGLPMISDRFDMRQQTRLRNGLRVIGCGHAITLASVLVFALLLTINIWGVGDIPESWGVAAVISSGAGLVVIWFGLIYWASLPGKVRWYSIIVMVLQLFATFGVASFFARLLLGQSTSGFVELFAAAAFALLLISQALVALIGRSLAKLFPSRLAIHASELAVVGYAIAGTLCSAGALNMLPRRVYGDSIPFAVLAALVVALVAQTIAHAAALGVFRRPEPYRQNLHL